MRKGRIVRAGRLFGWVGTALVSGISEGFGHGVSHPRAHSFERLNVFRTPGFVLRRSFPGGVPGVTHGSLDAALRASLGMTAFFGV